MKILLIGATGTIGSAVGRALEPRHTVVRVSRHSTPSVDITRHATIGTLFEAVTGIEAVVCCAGGGAWKPLAQLTDQDFETSLHDKLMGQVHVIRAALQHVTDRGSITVTSGVLARQPMQGSAAISLVNAGLEGFVRAAALEAPRGIRVNVVSPPWVSETLTKLGQDPAGGLPADVVARAYVSAVEGSQTGATIEPTVEPTIEPTRG
jgi:NAD(P)-dependent dehydrogenase (short-subunit alcohol dehydrogenase family)